MLGKISRPKVKAAIKEEILAGVNFIFPIPRRLSKNPPILNQFFLTDKFSFPRLIAVVGLGLGEHEIDGVRKEKERLTAACLEKEELFCSGCGFFIL